MVYEITLSNRFNEDEFVLSISTAVDEETAIKECLEIFTHHDIDAVNVISEEFY
jgi:hypothetical protein